MDDDCDFSVDERDYHCDICMAMDMIRHQIEDHEDTLIQAVTNIIESTPMPGAVNLLGNLLAVHYNPDMHEMLRSKHDPGRTN